MAYIPASQIKTNQFTSGDGDSRYIRSDNNQVYIGHYYSTSKGEAYTGNEPNDGPNVLLLRVTPTNTTLPDDNVESIIGEYYYNGLKKINLDQRKIIPRSQFPKPSPQDYINESFVRYFAKKRNAVKYLEIDKETYDKLFSQDPTYLFELYKPLKLNWQISGDKAQSYQTNETQTALLARRERLEGFIEYFKGNFNQLYALYTQGNTYVIANNGKPYTGFYHVMGDGQVMTGKTHTNKGINLVLREDYVEQEKPPLKQEPSLTADEENIPIPSTTPSSLPSRPSYTPPSSGNSTSNSSY